MVTRLRKRGCSVGYCVRPWLVAMIALSTATAPADVDSNRTSATRQWSSSSPNVYVNIRALREDLANTDGGLCALHDSCDTCVQDPCSRTNSKHYSNSTCSWCSESGKESCMPLSIAEKYCQTESIVTNVSRCWLSQPALWRKDEQRTLSGCSELLVTDFFIANLSHSEDIEKITATGNSNFSTLLAICKNVSKDTNVVQTCGHSNPIEVLADSKLFESHKQCWNIGNSSEASLTPITRSDPAQGAILDYGYMNCCPNSTSGPGEYSKVSVKVLLKPGPAGRDVWSIDSVNVSPLLYCPSDSAVNFQIVVLTSRLNEAAVEYRLDENKTSLDCWEEDENVTCTVTPFRATDRSSFPSYDCTRRINISLIYDTGLYKNKSLLEVERPNGNCTFRLTVEKHLVAVSALYSYPYLDKPVYVTGGGESSNPYKIRKTPRHSSYWYYYAVGPLVAVALILAVIGLVKKCHVVSTAQTRDSRGLETRTRYGAVDTFNRSDLNGSVFGAVSDNAGRDAEPSKDANLSIQSSDEADMLLSLKSCYRWDESRSSSSRRSEARAIEKQTFRESSSRTVACGTEDDEAALQSLSGEINQAAVVWGYADIDQNGGSLEVGSLTVEIPQGAVDERTRFTASLYLDSNLMPQLGSKDEKIVSPVVYLEPHNKPFNVPVRVRLQSVVPHNKGWTTTLNRCVSAHTEQPLNWEEIPCADDESEDDRWAELLQLCWLCTKATASTFCTQRNLYMWCMAFGQPLNTDSNTWKIQVVMCCGCNEVFEQLETKMFHGRFVIVATHKPINVTRAGRLVAQFTDEAWVVVKGTPRQTIEESRVWSANFDDETVIATFTVMPLKPDEIKWLDCTINVSRDEHHEHGVTLYPTATVQNLSEWPPENLYVKKWQYRGQKDGASVTTNVLVSRSQNVQIGDSGTLENHETTIQSSKVPTESEDSERKGMCVIC